MCSFAGAHFAELRPDLSSSVSVFARLRSWSCFAGSGAVDQFCGLWWECSLESTSCSVLVGLVVGSCRVAHFLEWLLPMRQPVACQRFRRCRSDRSGSAAPPLSGRALTGARPALYRLSLCLRFRLSVGRPFRAVECAGWESLWCRLPAHWREPSGQPALRPETGVTG